MSEPPEWALREAGQLITYGADTIGHMNANTVRVALALAAARRRGIEEAALRCVRLGFERYDQGAEPLVASAYHNAAAAIRALADKEPT